ncbi:MAG: TPM domain-containing protein [Verrucomicrobia bacterium]|nr:TPM domain-containing protein [Verrucomicrobiota bacterium]
MNLFTRSPNIDHPRIEAAIAAAERLTSGEIRVVVSRRAAPEPVAAARHEFNRLGMDATSARNGVLIFLAPRSRTFAVIGDTGVHTHCGDAFWREVAAAMEAAFRRDDFTSGLVLGIERTGALLATHFPRSPDDRNELPNQVEIV